jgi:hypothetical protein
MGTRRLKRRKRTAHKAKRPKVWKTLERDGKLKKHWPDPGVVKQAIELLKANGQFDAIKRIEAFDEEVVSEREEIHNLTEYDN